MVTSNFLSLRDREIDRFARARSLDRHGSVEQGEGNRGEILVLCSQKRSLLTRNFFRNRFNPVLLQAFSANEIFDIVYNTESIDPFEWASDRFRSGCSLKLCKRFPARENRMHIREREEFYGRNG